MAEATRSPPIGTAPRLLSRLRGSAEWRFLGILPRASRLLTGAWWSLVGLRGMLPAVFAIIVGAVIGAVEEGAGLAVPLTAAGVVFVAMNALAPIHDAVSANLGARTGAWLHDRLMVASADPPGLAHLETPDLADELARAREFDLGITAPPLSSAMPNIGNGFVEVLSGVAQAVLLGVYRWWAAVVLAAAWLGTHVLLRESAHWKVWASDAVVAEQRHVEYAYRLTVDAPAAKEIRLFGLGGWAVERFRGRRRRLTETLFRERRLRQRPIGWTLLVILAANGLVFWSLGHDAATGALALDRLVVFAQAAVGTSALAFGEFDWWFRGSAQPIPGALDLAGRMATLGGLGAGTRSSVGPPVRDIEFHDVRFAYASSVAPVLDGLDLRIPAGSSMAIVGPNGAGKTTLVKLLCRLYDPQRGRILVDGVDLLDLDLDAWRSRLAAVFQDFIRYDLPLRDNVAPAGAPDDAIRVALEQAGATGLADLDTVLTRAQEGGTDLSGGEWQRIALARALCSVRLGAGVVILDEPTAQLDVRGEAEIFDRILEATRGSTTILISHRFSTVRHADRICVLEHGRVVELGTHDELMAGPGRYRTMFDLQASRFGEEDDAPGP